MSSGFGFWFVASGLVGLVASQSFAFGSLSSLLIDFMAKKWPT